MNLEKWKTMTWRQRLAWFWEYYGIITICSVAGIAVIGYLVASMFGLTSEPCDLRVMILDDRVDYEKTDAISEYLEQQIGGNVEVLGYHSVVQEEMQAFSVKACGDEIDVVIAPENEMLQLKDNNFFENGYEALSQTGFYSECLYEEAALENTDEFIGVCVRGPHRENAKLAVELLQKERMK